MQTLDLVIIFGYLIGVTLFGVWFSRRQETTEDYFVGSRNVPWWAIAASIVATETSTITFISVPGIAFAKNGNFQFLQLVFGYMLGRVVISLVFIPLYFKGELQTVYQLLGERFGTKVKILASALFVVMRNIADGIRLLLTAIVLAAVYTAFQPQTDAGYVVVGSIILLGAVMIIFTYYGGMEAVIWVEVVQLAIYLGGAIAAAIVLSNQIEGGFSGAIELGQQFNKFSLFDFTFDMTKTFTFWSGLIGGCFLTMSTHGTDQYLVQRYLCTDKASRASFALLSSGAVVLGQFIGFLFIGVLLFAFYAPHTDPLFNQVADACAKLNPEQAAKCFAEPAFAQSATNFYPFKGGDQVFPDFITKHMPTGLSGLVVAAIFAAALSSSLNSIAATFVNDLYKPFRRNLSDKHYLKVSHWLTLIIGVVQILVALAMMKQQRSALDQALSVASLINGPILGVFLVGTFLKRVTQTPALVGMAASILLMLYIRFATPVAYTWYVLIGSLTTLLVAWLASFIFSETKNAAAAN
ncbi:MAG TPA: sodium:solute symporter [Pyrinomonadaceae bacterium]|jgi:SSS family transporter